MTDTGKTIDRDVLHTEFALGLIAGEGSFYLTFGKDDRRRFGVTPGIRFQLNMGQYSEPLLKWAADVVDLGRVTDHNNGYAWTISSREDCHALRSLIDEHVANHESGFKQTPKYSAYQRWIEALDIMCPDATLLRDDLRELARIRGSINKMPNGRARSTSEILSLIEDAKD